jgi:hypothetical protein
MTDYFKPLTNYAGLIITIVMIVVIVLAVALME